MTAKFAVIDSLGAAYPEKAEDGAVTGVLGCLTDISQQKWAEGYQTQKRLEAVELKRQTENFIDMTSHEMCKCYTLFKVFIIRVVVWNGSYYIFHPNFSKFSNAHIYIQAIL